MAETQRLKRRTLFVGVAIGVLLVVTASLVAANDTGFTDVPSGTYWHDSVKAIKDAGVTGGCSATKYCPNNNVTRKDMAVFLNKLGALGPGTTPVANATKLDGLDSSAFQRDVPTIETDVETLLIPSDTAVLSDTLTVPTGITCVLQVTAGGAVDGLGDVDQVRFQFEDNGTPFGQFFDFTVPASAGAGVTAVAFKTATAGTHVIDLVATNNSGADNVHFHIGMVGVCI
jgi:hypothetical protein